MNVWWIKYEQGLHCTVLVLWSVCVFMERSVLVGCNMESCWGHEKSLYKEYNVFSCRLWGKALLYSEVWIKWLREMCGNCGALGNTFLFLGRQVGLGEGFLWCSYSGNLFCSLQWFQRREYVAFTSLSVCPSLLWLNSCFSILAWQLPAK